MMWMMILCCALFLGALFLGGSSLSLSGYLWPILIGAFVLAHIWMMFRGHGEHGNSDDDKKIDADSRKQSEKHNDHKHGGCCH